MDELVRKVYRDIVNNGLLEKGDSVVAGISGGADSMCLLYVLIALRSILNLELTAVHIHHGLRGEAADGDRDFVKAVCEETEVAFVCYQTDIRVMAAECHLTEEEAGRIFRYACFEQVREELCADRIAVAHHMDDMAETVLMNLFRGSGVKGIAGIPAVRGAVVRPLLHVSRAEIEGFLKRKNITYRIDATNFETEYTRNRIRIDVLPYITQHINPAAVSHIADTAAVAADICRYMELQAQQAETAVVRWERDSGSVVCELDVEGFRGLDRALQRELLRQIIGKAAGQMKDIGMVHIESVRQLMDGNAGRKLSLPYGLTAVKAYQSMRIIRDPVESERTEPDHVRELCLPEMQGTCCVDIDRHRFVISLFSAEKKMQIPKKMYTKWFDYDRIKNRLVLRCRREGDYMFIGGGHKKMLRRILMDDRIPQTDRDQLLLLADGSHILWIPDTGRMSEYYKITEETKHILAVQMKEIRDGRED